MPVTNGVLACWQSARITELTSPACLAWLFGALWPPVEITVVPLSPAAEEINSSGAEGAGGWGSARGAGGAKALAAAVPFGDLMRLEEKPA